MRTRNQLISCMSILWVCGPISVTDDEAVLPERDYGIASQAVPNTAPRNVDGLLKRLRAAVECRTSREARQAYKGILDLASLAELRKLRCGEDAGIALRAAWEPVRRSIAEHATANEDSTNARFTPDSAPLNRFIGFVEGRLKVVIPEAWLEIVESAEANSQQTVQFPGLRRNAAGFHKTDAGLIAGPGLDVSRTDNGVLVTIGDDSFQLDDVVLEGSDAFVGHIAGISALMDKRSCYAALYSSDCRNYYLYCIDRDSGKRRWRQEVWAGAPVGLLRSGYRHCVWMQAQDDTVYLLGLCFDCVYIEAFATDDGKPLFRFSTSY